MADKPKTVLTLKWGVLKGYEGALDGTPFGAAIDKYYACGVTLSVASQPKTPGHDEALYEAIDHADVIWNDWTGEAMTKDEAKAYVRNYRNKQQ